MPSGTQPRWVQTPSVISQFGLPGLVRCGERLGIAQLRQRHRVGFGDFLRRQVADEHRLLAPLALMPCPGWTLEMSTSVVAMREHVGRRRHLDEQRRERGDGADAGEADRGDIEEIAAANALSA